MSEPMKIGGKYNWKGQAERLVYLGKHWSGNGKWHQFALVDQPGVVWCEVVDADLSMFEETPQPTVAAPQPAVITCAGQPLPIEKIIEWASQAGFTWRNPARDRCLAEFAELVQVFGSEAPRDLSDEDLDAAIDRSGWPQNMISDFIRDKLREACRFALAAAAGKVNSKVNSGGSHGQA